MARNYRFFLRNSESFHLLQDKQEVLNLSENLEPEIVFQLLKVLRIQPGDTIILIPQKQESGQVFVVKNEKSGQFHEHMFEVKHTLKHAVELTFKETVINQNELNFSLNLWLCVPNKPDKLEFILQKAVEIGVANISLYESDFSQMKHKLRMDRLEKIMIEAAEQSERAFIPKLEMQGSLMKKLLSVEQRDQNDKSPLGQVWVAMERLKFPSPANPFVGIDFHDSLTVLVGPEGGFSTDEKTLFEKLSMHAFSLGRRILRMETAAVLSLGLAALLDA